MKVIRVLLSGSVATMPWTAVAHTGPHTEPLSFWHHLTHIGNDGALLLTGLAVAAGYAAVRAFRRKAQLERGRAL